MLLYEIYNSLLNKLHIILNRSIKYIILKNLHGKLDNNNFTTTISNQENNFTITVTNIFPKSELINNINLPFHIDKLKISELEIFFPKNFYQFNNCKILIKNIKIEISENKIIKLNSFAAKEFIFKSQINTFPVLKENIESIQIIEELIKYLKYHFNIYIKNVTVSELKNNLNINFKCCFNKSFNFFNCKIYKLEIKENNIQLVKIPSLLIKFEDIIDIHITETKINIDETRNHSNKILNFIEKYKLFNSEGSHFFQLKIDKIKLCYNYTHKIYIHVNYFQFNQKEAIINSLNGVLSYNNVLIPIIKITTLNILLNNTIINKIDKIKIIIYKNLINKIIPFFYKIHYIFTKNKKKEKQLQKYKEEKCISCFNFLFSICEIYLLDLNLDNQNLKRKIRKIQNNVPSDNIKIELNCLKFSNKYYSTGKIKNYVELDKIVINDNIHDSLWSKFLYNKEKKKCVKVKMFQIKKKNKNIYNIIIDLDNIALNIDQKCLIVLNNIIKSNIPEIISDPNYISLNHIDNFIIKSFNMIISYKPNKMDINKLLKGESKQVLQIGNVYDKEIIISKIYLKDINSFQELIQITTSIILADIKDKNLIKYLKSIEPLNHIFNIYSHFKHLIIDPIKNDGNNIFYRIGKSSFKFAKNISYEVLDISTKIISGTKTSLEKTTRHKVQNNRQSNFKNCPENTYQGFKQGVKLTSKRINDLKNEDLSIKSKIIQPVIGITDFTNNALTGIKNQIKPENYHNMKNRYG